MVSRVRSSANVADVITKVTDYGQALSHQIIRIHKVLRFWQAGRSTPSRLLRINRGLSNESTLAVKGEALNHRLHLVAWPVGSERRNHHLHQAVI
jgi:hypothetical protein